VPLEKLVEELAVERSLEHTPLFQVMVILQQSGAEGPALALPGLVLSPLGAENRTAKFDLTLMLDPRPGSPRAILGYNTDLFRRETVARLLGHFEGLLAGMVAEPERPIAELALLTEPERHQLLLGWNDTPAAAEDRPDLCLHQLFEGWVARRPGAPAAVLDGELLTYGALDRQAGALAARLRALGVGPESRVGLCLPRSFDLLAALLAVLKAGAAYVPLDPANPRDRLSFLLADSRVPVLLTVRSLAEELGEPLSSSPTRVICLDEEPAGNGPGLSVAVDPDGLAYVIYTSGSTGTPNGVLVPHRGAVNLIREAAALYQVTPESRILQTASVGFDASVLEIFLALAHGASLCLVREEERLTPAVLADRLLSQKVTTGVVTPSLLSVLPESRLKSLRSISVGGEACPAELSARWAPGRRFLNCYGPTETTIFATVSILLGEEEKITIGRPVANAAAYVVDRELLPLPIGAVGELVVGGVGLARGYLDRPEKTAIKFVPDPFSGGSSGRGGRGGRLYRTGDLARFTPSGEIEFLGRLDDQVKVRGFRIELGEIEAALLRHPGLQAAVVLAPADAGGERKLIAYAAGPAEARPTEPELRAFLAEHLPEYMVPAHLVLLDALPTTPGGKVDRRALPDPEGSRVETGEHVEPKTAAERFVAGLWKQVLGVERLSATDDFFALGGNSIKGAILTNLLQEKLGEYVYVVALFDAPTLSALARYLEENYTEALERVTGEKVSAAGKGTGRVEPAMLLTLREVIPPLAPKPAPTPKNPRAVFLLSPPRSGSTLLRVMLAGNPALFAPPELELLGFNTLAERQEALSGRWALWQEGTLRALMEVYACGADEARRRMDDALARGLSVQQFYRQLQEAIAIGGRLLVDKTPSYALDPATLARAEEDFAAPLYVHLLRHPYGMIRSFEKAKLEQVFFRPSHPFDRRQLAELIWDVSQENILALLARVPAERQIELRFEEMLKEPEREMRRVCEFLGVPFDTGMLDPYADKAKRMTDGIHQLSKMVGDVKFHEHKGIEAQTADSWRREIEEDFLGDVTWNLAGRLGYTERVRPEAKPRFSPLVPIQTQGSGRPLFLVHPVGGNVLCYTELARKLGDQPVYGLQSLGLGGEPQETVQEMASSYVAAIRSVQPHGPYRLGGWSIGGAIAYEMAQQLSAGGEEVEALFLLDTLAPAHSREEEVQEVSEAVLLAGLARDLAGLSGRPVALDPAELEGLDPEAGLARVIERVRAAGALPAGLSEEQIGRLWRVFRANVRAVRAYAPKPYPGRVALFVTASHPERGTLGADLGWGRLVGEGLETAELPGDHYSLLRGPVAQELADRLRGELAATACN
jgi:amino acid adenylation domain-containing protein